MGFLFRKKPPPTSQRPPPLPMSEADLLDAAEEGDVAKVQRCLAAGVSVSCKDGIGATPLHCAACYGHKEVAALLLGAGAAVDAATKSGATPLHYAAYNGHKEVAALLLGAGAAVDAADMERKTPLYFAAKYGCKEVAVLLLDAGAAVDAADKDGKTPADVCCTAASESNKANKGPILAALTAAAAARKAAGEASTDARHAEASGSNQATTPPAPTESAAAARHQAGKASLSQSMQDLHVGGSDQQAAPLPRLGNVAQPWKAAILRLPAAALDTFVWDVFISHAGNRADKPFARKLKHLLEVAFEMRVFLDDESIPAAGNPEHQMDEAMYASRVGLLLLSRQFFERPATRHELDVLVARQQDFHLQLLPVCLRLTVEGCEKKWEETFPGGPAFPSAVRHAGEVGPQGAKPEQETMMEVAYKLCTIVHLSHAQERWLRGIAAFEEHVPACQLCHMAR